VERFKSIEISEREVMRELFVLRMWKSEGCAVLKYSPKKYNEVDNISDNSSHIVYLKWAVWSRGYVDYLY
jgi:hypothetical protein